MLVHCTVLFGVGNFGLFVIIYGGGTVVADVFGGVEWPLRVYNGAVFVGVGRFLLGFGCYPCWPGGGDLGTGGYLSYNVDLDVYGYVCWYFFGSVCGGCECGWNECGILVGGVVGDFWFLLGRVSRSRAVRTGDF